MCTLKTVDAISAEQIGYCFGDTEFDHF